jgi:diguanylate cyclase (GGDEF)-like protein
MPEVVAAIATALDEPQRVEVGLPDGLLAELSRLAASAQHIDVLSRQTLYVIEAIAEALATDGTVDRTTWEGPVRLIGGMAMATLASHVAARINHEAIRNPLTGLLNKKVLFADLDREIASGSDFVLVAADIDGLKRVNDEHGHVAGDALIREVAQKLVVGMPADATPYHLGGDEFAAIVRAITTDEVSVLMEQIAAGAPSFSWGVVTSSDLPEGSDGEHAYHRADIVMYETQKRPKKQVREGQQS